MKNRKRATDIVKKALIAFLAATIAFTSISPVYVHAGTKTITLNVSDQVSYASQARAKSITKKGTYTIKVKQNGFYYMGYLMFKAPKAGTYKFEFSKIKDGSKPVSGYVYGTTPSEYDTMIEAPFSTKGGTSAYLNMASKKSGNYLTKRTGKIKLAKGQKLYMFFDFQRSFSSKSKKMSVKLKIK